MAVEAIVREHYRDAVGSFASSLERLWEFFTHVICRHRGVTADAFASVWKPMANSSERQAGGFMIAHAIEMGSPAPLLSNRVSEFRNRVVHKGYLPTREEAIDFGQSVADCAYPLLHMLGSEKFSETVLKLGFELIRARGKAAHEAGCRTSTVALALVFEPTQTTAPVSIKAAVEKFAAQPDLAKAVEGSRELGRQIDLS